MHGFIKTGLGGYKIQANHGLKHSFDYLVRKLFKALQLSNALAVSHESANNGYPVQLRHQTCAFNKMKILSELLEKIVKAKPITS